MEQIYIIQALERIQHTQTKLKLLELAVNTPTGGNYEPLELAQKYYDFVTGSFPKSKEIKPTVGCEQLKVAQDLLYAVAGQIPLNCPECPSWAPPIS